MINSDGLVGEEYASRFPEEYKQRLKEGLIKHSNNTIKPCVADKISEEYVTNLVNMQGFQNKWLMLKDPSSIARDMVMGLKPEMFKDSDWVQAEERVQSLYTDILQMLTDLGGMVELIIRTSMELSAYYQFIKNKPTVLEEEVDFSKLRFDLNKTERLLTNKMSRIELEFRKIESFIEDSRVLGACENALNFLNAYPRRIRNQIFKEE